MKKRTLRRTMAIITALPLSAAWSHAQSSPAAAAPETEAASDEDVVVLSPFEVTTETEGYKAVDTLAGGRVRTDLKDTAAALSVVTSKLMSDLGVTNAEDLLVYTNNTEVAGLSGNFSGLSNRGTGVALAGAAENSRLSKPAEVNRSRGLTAMDNTRNYFTSDIPWDGYNISRVDISRGPNSFLFGVGSPSGISNASTNDAMFVDKGNIEVRYGSFGSTRESLDVNKVLIPSQLAVRVDLVNDDKQFRQDPAFNHSKRAYGALRFDPKFLKSDSAYTRIQASFEHGTVKSNNPRTLPPVDYVTGYLNDPAASDTGYDPWQYTMDTNISVDPSKSLWAASGSVGNQYQWGNGPQLYWDAKTGALLFAGAASSTSPTGSGYGASSNTYNVHSQGYSGYAKAANYLWRQANGSVETADTPFAGAYRGTVKYYDETLSDPSVFDFYNHLIDGDNKREWQRWNAWNVSIVQSLFDERLVVQAVMDRQEYHRGDESLMSSRTPTIMLDLNSYKLNADPTWLAGAEANPNVGRPLVFGDQGNRNTTDTTRENYQVTAAYNLNFERDFHTKGLWAKILGRHDFTALGSRSEKSEESRSYRLSGVDYSYNILTGNNLNARPVDNNYNWLAYMGPSVLGSSGVRTGFTGLGQTLTPAATNSYSYFSKTWTADSSINPTDPWTYTGKDGSSVTQIQADNPANYQGYTGIDIPTLYRGDNVLGTGGSKNYQKISSIALLYQGHFWDDTIVPTFGYRRDTTLQRGNNPTEANGYVDPTTGIVDFNYDITDEGVESTTISRSYGIAFHLPKAIKKHLPEGTDLTFYYFHGANETPKVRYGLDGSQLPNETGETDDYSVQFDGFDGRLTARLTYFKTVDKNAFASVGQPLGTYMVKSLPEWTLLLHAYSMAHAALPKDENGYYQIPASWDSWTKESWANWPYGWMTDHPAEAAAVNEAMMTTFADAFPQSYWDAYGYNIDVAAIRAGDWTHVVKGTDFPYFPPQTGGSETIHGQYPTIDQNIESKGFELEVTFRPMKNWDITLNASKVDATQTGYGAAASKHLQMMADVFLGSPIQYAGIWGGYEGAKNSFLSDIWAPYLTQIALIGSVQPEQRKYRFNVISNYRFESERLKGLNVGGAFRWQGKAVNGYRIHQTEIYGETSWIADVNQPIYGPTDEHLDLWVGYERALNSKVTWRTQLNLRNVGESKSLVPITYQPDGSVAQSRIQEGMTYDLSLKFMF